MAIARAFTPVKLICGVLASDEEVFEHAQAALIRDFGPLEKRSADVDFTFTDYYEKQMGAGLKKKLLSFRDLIDPESISRIKVHTNSMEKRIRKFFLAKNRIVNLDPGYLTASALIMATVKDFSHRIPLQNGIYGHLELLFTRREIRVLDWTYPDYRTGEFHRFLREVRNSYLEQLRQL